MRNMLTIMALCLMLAGCPGAGPGGRTGTVITFSPSSGFPQGQDPATFDIGGGSVTAAGGTAGTLGLVGFYADGRYAWDLTAPATAGITFNNLEVVAVDGYWVHPDAQAAGATMTVNFSGGGSVPVPSAPVNTGGPLGQLQGFFDTVNAPDGETITDLTFEFDAAAPIGSIAALGVLELTLSAS